MDISERKKYLAFLDMLLTVTMLSNEFNNDLDNDASTIISFIGVTYDLYENEIDECKRLILSDLTTISTIADVQAFQADKNKTISPILNNFLYLKANTILLLKNIYDNYDRGNFDQYYFNYLYLRPYNSSIRFNELITASIKGNIYVNRTVAIMLALGIGHSKNVKSALYRLKQCAYWGDVSSIYYLAYLYKNIGDDKQAKLYSNLLELVGYASEGRTVLNEELKAKYDVETQQTFALITSIKHDIVLQNNIQNINLSFLEVILSDDIDYYKKINYINQYLNQEWKEVTNSSDDPSKKFGFIV